MFSLSAWPRTPAQRPSLLSEKQPLQERRAFPSSWLGPEFSSLACLLITGYSGDLEVDIGKEGIN